MKYDTIVYFDFSKSINDENPLVLIRCHLFGRLHGLLCTYNSCLWLCRIIWPFAIQCWRFNISEKKSTNHVLQIPLPSKWTLIVVTCVAFFILRVDINTTTFEQDFLMETICHTSFERSRQIFCIITVRSVL
jgi:hypothetical protein